jgi:hypothetical protein
VYDLSVYSNNFWSYAKNIGKEATLDEVFIKWANKIDLDINLGKEIYKEVTAEVNSLFGKKAFVTNPIGTPAADGIGNSGAIPVGDPTAMTPPNPGVPETMNQNNIPVEQQEIDPITGQPKEPDNMLSILKGE